MYCMGNQRAMISAGDPGKKEKTVGFLLAP
jgi:hypothetical protein